MEGSSQEGPWIRTEVWMRVGADTSQCGRCRDGRGCAGNRGCTGTLAVRAVSSRLAAWTGGEPEYRDGGASGYSIAYH